MFDTVALLVSTGSASAEIAQVSTPCVGAPLGLVTVATDPAQPIAVKQGQSFLIALRSNPSTGYHWNMRSLTSTVVRAKNNVSLADNAFPPPSGATPGPVMVGVPVTQLFLFDVTSAGMVTLTFDLLPPASATPASSATFTVNATPSVLCSSAQ